MLTSSLAASAAQQGGAFTVRQAVGAGYAEEEIRRLVTAGRWVRLRRGVYAEKALVDGLSTEGAHQLHMRAVTLKLGRRAVASHETAAVFGDLPMLRPDLDEVHVTRADLGASRLEAGVRHHAAALPADHVTTTADVPHTVSARTAVDIARKVGFLRGVAVCDSALRAGTGEAELKAMMAFCATWPGARDASRAVTFANGRAANPGESWSRVVLAQIGLPEPELQVEFRDGRGLVGISDFYLRAQRTVGEFDGKWKYKVPEGASAEDAGEIVYQEKLREDRFRGLGLEVVRWVWADLYQPEMILYRFLRAFERAAGRAA